MKLKATLSLIVIALFVLFVLQNTVPSEIRFLLWQASMSKALWLIFALILGLVTGLLWPTAKKKDQPDARK